MIVFQKIFIFCQVFYMQFLKIAFLGITKKIYTEVPLFFAILLFQSSLAPVLLKIVFNFDLCIIAFLRTLVKGLPLNLNIFFLIGAFIEDFQKNILKVRIFSYALIFKVIVKIFFKVIYVKRTIIPVKLCFSISLK